MFTGICAQRGANSSKHNHRSRTLPPAPPANSGRIRQGASASKTLILFNSARDAERGGRSAPARAAFLRRRNGLRCAALFLRLRTVPRPGLRPRAGWLRLRAGCAHASRGLRLAAPHGRRGGIPPAGGFYSLCRGCTSYSHYSILRTAPRPLSYSAIKQWPGGCGFILSLWPTFVNP